jgi:hypothetical protein
LVDAAHFGLLNPHIGSPKNYIPFHISDSMYIYIYLIRLYPIHRLVQFSLDPIPFCSSDARSLRVSLVVMTDRPGAEGIGRRFK